MSGVEFLMVCVVLVTSAQQPRTGPDPGAAHCGHTHDLERDGDYWHVLTRVDRLPSTGAATHAAPATPEMAPAPGSLVHVAPAIS